MCKAIIVDHDENTCSLTYEMIHHYFPEINVVARATSLLTGIKEICKLQPELVFMDIELPDGKGNEIFDLTFFNPIRVIFITDYKEFTNHVINHGLVGYLIKPVSELDFINVVQKAMEQIAMIHRNREELHQVSCIPLRDKIVVRTTESIHIIPREKIVRCESFRNYTTIYPIYEKGILASQTLKEFENMLPYPEFIRVHQSHLVNTGYIKRIDKAECSLLMTDNTHIPIAIRKRDLVMRFINAIALTN